MSWECLHSFIELYHCNMYNMYILMKAHYTWIKLFSYNLCWKFCRLKASGWFLTDIQIKTYKWKVYYCCKSFLHVHFPIYKRNIMTGPTSWVWKRNVSDLSSLESVYHFLVKWKKRKVKSLSHVQLFVTPWTVAYHAPLSYLNVSLFKK